MTITHRLSVLCVLLVATTAYAAPFKIVKLTNMTSCHILNEKNYPGRATYIGTYTAPFGSGYSAITPGQVGDVPILSDKSSQYAIFDRYDAGDEYSVTYRDGDRYIISNDNKPYDPFIILPYNPCA